MPVPVAQCLSHWLEQRISAENWQWLSDRVQQVRESSSDRDLHIALGLVPRKLGRSDLNLSEEDVLHAQRETNSLWDPSDWTVETAARTLLLSAAAQRDDGAFGDLFKSLVQTADLTESITFYRGTAVLPYSETLDKQVGEGLRTNIRAVFEAIAHRNPYPQTHFDENRWNHMVLKALFIDSTLWPIQGLDDRANPELARILCDYAHERWAASRPVTPELWRCVGPFATGAAIDDLRRVAKSDSLVEQQAGLLALSQSTDPAALETVEQYPLIAASITNGTTTWESIAHAATESVS